MKLIGRVLKIAYHRNGIAGNGFYVVLFKPSGRYEGHPTLFLATVFNEPGNIAVLALDSQRGLDNRIIGFADNSWRGDHFEPELREYIANA